MTELEMSPLRRLTMALGSAIASDEVADAILLHGLHELGALTVSLWLIGEGGTTLDYAGGAGSVTPGVERFASIPLSTDLPGPVVVSTAEPIVYRSTLERNERWPDLASVPSATEASIILPLEARQEVIGCLSVGFADMRDIDDDELAHLLTVADQCALAIDRARLLDRERRARETLEFLAEATRVMVSALDPVDVIDQLLSHAVPQVADWCSVFVHDAGVLRRTALKIAGAAELADRILREAAVVSVDADTPMSRAFQSGRDEHVATPDFQLIETLYGDAATVISELGMHDVVVCPIVTRGTRIGVISFAFTTSNRRFTPEVLAVATGLAARAGVALDVAQRFDRERRTAATLVAAMLPNRLPVIDGWSVVARYLPAGDAVCGDWYDVTLLPDGHLLIGAGDAAGHGLPAAALMAELRNAARGLAIAGHEPAHLLDDLSALAEQGSGESLATAAYGRLDLKTGGGRWAVAGHPAPLLIPFGAPPQYLDLPARPPLGVDAVPAEDREITLETGDSLLLYTDGLVERRGESLEDGLARLLAAAVSAPRDANGLADGIVEALCGDLSDDCCVLVVQRHLDTGLA
jgi:GAF domain-containing protein